MRAVKFGALLPIAGMWASLAMSVDAMTFADRVKAQEAIERVLYEHRLWPKENRTPKPPFEDVMPRSAIEAKVDDSLRKNAALEFYWRRPITPTDLQAEMDRISRDTKDPHLLRDLCAALGNEPRRIAECLARPLLVEREIHGRYARDARFHDATMARATRALGELTEDNFDAFDDGALAHLVYTSHPPRGGSSQAIAVDGPALAAIRARVGPPGRVRLLETDDDYEVVLLARDSPEEIEVLSRSFRKRRFDDWWSNAPEAIAPLPPALTDGFSWSDPSATRSTTCGGWLPSSLSLVPNERFGQVSVWTGTEMIVWGGDNITNPYSTGGRYDPATNTWARTSTGGSCPIPRQECTAVWTGTAMIVWGGYQSVAGLNTGARYDPVSDTWTPTSTGALCPSPRFAHTAVWTGTDMIVWGGTGVALQNTGARYNPVTDSWASTSVGPGCPLARREHVAVWTGSEMIVWGGRGVAPPSTPEGVTIRLPIPGARRPRAPAVP